jgi:hypothetical protein
LSDRAGGRAKSRKLEETYGGRTGCGKGRNSVQTAKGCVSEAEDYVRFADVYGMTEQLAGKQSAFRKKYAKTYLSG